MSKSNENVDHVMELVLENTITAHEVANMLGTLFASVHSILKDNLNTCHTADELAPSSCPLCFASVCVSG